MQAAKFKVLAKVEVIHSSNTNKASKSLFVVPDKRSRENIETSYWNKYGNCNKLDNNNV